MVGSPYRRPYDCNGVVLSVVLQHFRAFYRGDPADVDDRQLLERFLTQRDEAAFEALLRRHGPLVLGVCRRLLSDTHDVEDAFQATFLVLLRKAPSMTRSELLAGWLYGVACRTALHARGRIARERARQRPLESAAEIASAKEESGDDLREVLDEEVSRLPRKYRLPVVLCYLQGKTLAEAGRQLGWPVGTVSGRLARARELLRQRLTRRNVTLSAAWPAVALSQGMSPAVPPCLTAATLSNALTFMAGGALAPSVAVLTKGVLQAMFMTKVKTAVVLLLALGTLTLGAGLFTYSQVAAPQPKDSKGPEGEPAAQAKEKQELPPVQAANRREKVVELMKARVEAARTEVELRTARYRLAVEGASLDQLLAALERLLHAESELVLQRNRGVAFPTGNLRLEQAAVYEAHLKRVKPIEELCQKLLQVQPGIKADLNQVIYYRLQAEILLESTNALLKFGQPAKDNP